MSYTYVGREVFNTDRTDFLIAIMLIKCDLEASRGTVKSLSCHALTPQRTQNEAVPLLPMCLLQVVLNGCVPWPVVSCSC